MGWRICHGFVVRISSVRITASAVPEI